MESVHLGAIVPLPNSLGIWIWCKRNDTSFTSSYSLDGTEFEMICQLS